MKLSLTIGKCSKSIARRREVLKPKRKSLILRPSTSKLKLSWL